MELESLWIVRAPCSTTCLFSASISSYPVTLFRCAPSCEKVVLDRAVKSSARFRITTAVCSDHSRRRCLMSSRLGGGTARRGESSRAEWEPGDGSEWSWLGTVVRSAVLLVVVLLGSLAEARPSTPSWTCSFKLTLGSGPSAGVRLPSKLCRCCCCFSCRDAEPEWKDLKVTREGVEKGLKKGAGGIMDSAEALNIGKQLEQLDPPLPSSSKIDSRSISLYTELKVLSEVYT